VDQLQPAIENEDLKVTKCPAEAYNSKCRVYIWQNVVKTETNVTVLYCNVPIEFFFGLKSADLNEMANL